MSSVPKKADKLKLSLPDLSCPSANAQLCTEFLYFNLYKTIMKIPQRSFGDVGWITYLSQFGVYFMSIYYERDQA